MAPSIYERLTGTHGTKPKLPVHQFQSATAEQARGNMTAQQHSDIMVVISGMGYDATELLEVADLIATFPVGSTALIIANRAIRTFEVDQTLMLAEMTVPNGLAPLATTAALRTRLGVQTR